MSNTFGGVWSNDIGQYRETDKKHDELARVKFSRDAEGGWKAPGIRNCSIKI